MLSPQLTPQLLKNLELFKIHSRRAFLGTRQGGHISLKRGHGLEFSDYRRYELGDNPRHIDWGVYARSDKLIVKTFQEEQDLSVLILIDPSNSMHTGPSSAKWDRAGALALALSYVALMEQDRVSLHIPGVLETPFLTGARAIHTLASALKNAHPKQPADLSRSVQQSISKIRFPGLAIFISDFLMPLENTRGFTDLPRAKNLDICAIQLLGEADTKPFNTSSDALAEDSETGERVAFAWDAQSQTRYEYLLQKHNAEVRQAFLSRGVSHALHYVEGSLEQFLLHTLPAAGLLR